MKTTNRTRRREQSPIVTQWVRPVLIGLIAGVLACLLLLLLFSMVMAMADLPQKAVTPLAVIAAAAGAFIGGLICARVTGSNGLLYGALCGAALYVLVMLAGFIVLHDIRGVYALAKLLIMTGVGGVGGIIGVNSKRR